MKALVWLLILLGDIEPVVKRYPDEATCRKIQDILDKEPPVWDRPVSTWCKPEFRT